ncbi:GntR family transcriptional regulator [Nonomuraea diastatica]|uniref:GntR family transcriptional regulator n=1 Tax=Nonomuraea diastatica TaxID=1848329 RepID=A0A4R4W8K6_9ACTN|nr:GntR family transcriptional regulator [Nonomuraea diastatica]
MPIPPAKAQGIADQIAARIRRGDYPPGSWLPSERELSQEHQANRATIRNALKLLADESLVTRIPSQGVQVSGPSAPRSAARPPQPAPEVACEQRRCCLTLAGMTAWLASQDRLTLVRIDDITSVQIVVPGEPDPRLHPTKRLDRAEEVQIMVGSRAGVAMCATTCPGRDALWARDELLHVVNAMRRTTTESAELYVHAPASWPRKRPGQLWQTSSHLPAPELIQR